MLVVVFKNLAAYDRPMAEARSRRRPQYETIGKAHDMAMQRENMRKILGTELYRQLAFTQ